MAPSARLALWVSWGSQAHPVRWAQLAAWVKQARLDLRDLPAQQAVSAPKVLLGQSVQPALAACKAMTDPQGNVGRLVCADLRAVKAQQARSVRLV